MTTIDTEELMTVAEVQERFKIGRSKIYEIVARRELPAVRIGRAVRLRKADVEKYLEDSRY